MRSQSCQLSPLTRPFWHSIFDCESVHRDTAESMFASSVSVPSVSLKVSLEEIDDEFAANYWKQLRPYLRKRGQVLYEQGETLVIQVDGLLQQRSRTDLTPHTTSSS